MQLAIVNVIAPLHYCRFSELSSTVRCWFPLPRHSTRFDCSVGYSLTHQLEHGEQTRQT